MSLLTSLLFTAFPFLLGSILVNVLGQIYFVNKQKPPSVWHWLPIIGSTVGYGKDPYAFFFRCKQRYGDIFTFTLLGMKVTVYLGPKGNDFILNGRLRDLNAEDVYGPLTVPVFGKGVVYDVDNAKFMDQKRLIKEGFSSQSLRSYVPLFVNEVHQYISSNELFQGTSGICDISTVFDEVALYCAAASLQGPEIRSRFDSTFAQLYRNLDDGFAPINFMVPGLPLPINRRRDHAQKTMSKLYMDIIRDRRRNGRQKGDVDDMLWALMDANYKDGSALTDDIIANMLIALLMGGQHNTASSGTWIMLELAHHPQLIEELLTEQKNNFGPDQLQFDDLAKLSLHNAVIKETLRLHSPIHSIMRKVKSPMRVPDTNIVVPQGHILLAAPGVLSKMEEYFPNAIEWDPYRWLRQNDINTESQQIISQKEGFGDGDVSSKATFSPYLPFGAGRHRCIGETFAYAQLTTILATFVRHLKWEQVHESAPVPPTDYSSMFSRPMHPATIRWSKR